MWYLSEWYIPKERTIKRLESQSETGVPFYLVLKKNQVPVAVAGLTNDVGLVHIMPEYKKYGPWVTTLYTIHEERRKGHGADLMGEIEKRAKLLKIDTLYLYTSTAETMYLRDNWIPLERLDYQGNPNVIMKKNL